MDMPSPQQTFRQSLGNFNTLQPWLLFCYDAKVPGHAAGQVDTPNAAAWLIRSGWAKVEDEQGSKVKAGPGQWLMPRPGKRRQQFAPNSMLLSINFRVSLHTDEQLFEQGLSRVLEAADYPDLEPAAVALVGEVLDRLGTEQGIRAHSSQTDLGGYLAVQKRLVGWMEVWASALMAEGLHPTLGVPEDSRVLEAMRFLKHRRGADYSQAPEAAAAHVGLGLAQLTRLFRQETGGTLRKYHEQLSRERAYDQLMYTDHTIQEIAGEIGFRHPSHFTMWFKKQHGATPTEFRKKSLQLRYFSR